MSREVIIQKKKPLSKTDFPEADQKRFWKKVQKEPKSNCWIWTGGYSEKWSYFCHKLISFSAVRVAYAFENGITPQDIRLMRTCDKEKCINPNHCDKYSNLPELKIHKKDCVKLWRKKNQGKCANYSKVYRERNPQKFKETQRVSHKKNWLRYRDRKQAKVKIRYKNDPLFKLKSVFRSRFRCALKLKKIAKNTSALRALGCSAEELKEHLESQFKPGMTWENHGSWHIDHIIPLERAKKYQEVYSLSHYTNLRPLWKPLNLIKGSK